jgi:hypothetical protein
MTHRVSFVAKDEAARAYCASVYTEPFEARLASEGPTELVLHDFARVLEEEARRQEWFDYYMAPSEGRLLPERRVLITDAQGIPKPLHIAVVVRNDD